MIAIKRVGIFGGTFDPIHFGHVHLISELGQKGYFDELIVVPSGQPWQKNPVASKFDRLEMTKLALEDLPVRVSDVEVKRSGNSYAIDTVLDMKHECDPCQIVWIAGSDTVSQLHTWHQIEKLAHFNIHVYQQRSNKNKKMTDKGTHGGQTYHSYVNSRAHT